VAILIASLAVARNGTYAIAFVVLKKIAGDDEGVQLGQCPRTYLARPSEIAELLCAARKGLGNTILNENYTFSGGHAAVTTDAIPAHWRFSLARLDEMFELATAQSNPPDS
jgi:hypothetical protein